MNKLNFPLKVNTFIFREIEIFHYNYSKLKHLFLIYEVILLDDQNFKTKTKYLREKAKNSSKIVLIHTSETFILKKSKKKNELQKKPNR